MTGGEDRVDPAPRTLLLSGVGLLAIGVIIAAALRTFSGATGIADQERLAAPVAAGLVGAVLVVVVALWSGLGRQRSPIGLAAVLVAGAVVGLVAGYFYAIADAVFFRADILLWTEGEFVGDILKTHLGRPLYGPPADLASLTYTPGSQLLTGWIARLAGFGGSVPAYRVIQVGYVGLAALASVLAWRRIVGSAGIRVDVLPAWLLGGLTAGVLFLVGGNTITNPFTHLLHNDALSLLVSALGYWFLVEYAATGKRAPLVAMALIPAVGFLVKQSLAIWAALYLGYLVVFDRRLGLRGILWFVLAEFGGIAAAAGLCYLIWGTNFLYWTVTVMGHHPVSPLRSLQHALAAWSYFGALLVGGVLVLPWRGLDRLTGTWVVAAILLAVEAYTSGIAWMLNHMGPGSLLAAVWLMAGLARLAAGATDARGGPWLGRLRPAAAAVALVFAMSGLGVVQLPVPTLPPDADRYAAAIEREFHSQPAERTMLDYGTWVYQPAGIVPRDRAAPSGEAGFTGTADFSGILGRIRERYYSKILVRGFGTGDFSYDHETWARSSGIQAALAANYRETHQIEAVKSRRMPPWFRTISVLEPRSDPGLDEHR